MKRIIQKLTLAVVLLTGTSSKLVATPPNTGIHGQTFLYISFGTPIEIEPGLWIGIPSVQLPWPASFKVLSAHSYREVARVTTDANGVYTLALPPGNYVLVPGTLTINAFFNCTASTGPIEITVRPKQLTLANIFYFQDGFCTIAGTLVSGSRVQGNGATYQVVGEPARDLPPSSHELQANEGHHQSGIIGRVGEGAIVAGNVLPNIVRVYSETGEPVAEGETEVQGNDLWHFQINLKPGTYTVTATVPGSFLNSIVFGVIVEKKQFTNVDLSFYTPL